MIDISTQYLGVKLRSPLVASASPLCEAIDALRRMEDAGVGAVVLPSLFEEQLDIETRRLSRSNSQSEEKHFDSGNRKPKRRKHGRLGRPCDANAGGRSGRVRVEQGPGAEKILDVSKRRHADLIVLDPASKGFCNASEPWHDSQGCVASDVPSHYGSWLKTSLGRGEGRAQSPSSDGPMESPSY